LSSFTPSFSVLVHQNQPSHPTSAGSLSFFRPP
jgi:hypothetical protein